MKKALVGVLSVILLMVVFSGCKSFREQQSWDKAKKENTFSAYSKHLGEFPNGSHSNLAREEVVIRYHLTQDDIDKLEELQRVNSLEANNFESVVKLVLMASDCLDYRADWSNTHRGRQIYNMFKNYDSQLVSRTLSRAILMKVNRKRVLFFAVKLGANGTEDELNRILLVHGDKSMAEDYLNSGSRKLNRGAAAWGRRNGYYIQSGPGSHRVNWGSF